MPYTPPSISPSGLHSVSPVKSSSSYAGLANGYPAPSDKQPQPRTATSAHQNYHARPLNHHRRSSGPTSPLRTPIPVAAFSQDRPPPRRPSPVRRTSNSSISSSDDEDDTRPTLNARHLPNLKELRDAIRELPQHKVPSPPGSPDQRFLNKAVLSDNIPPIPDTVRYDSTTSDGEQSSSTTPPDADETPDFPRMVRKKSGEVVKPCIQRLYILMPNWNMSDISYTRRNLSPSARIPPLPPSLIDPSFPLTRNIQIKHRKNSIRSNYRTSQAAI